MNDDKGRRGPPPAVVVRKPLTTVQVTPTAVPGSKLAAGPRPKPFGGRPPGRPRRSGPPRPPPTAEQIAALAKRERVPARIAKGDLEGKMKSRIWRKLHAEEAKRFDQAYALMEKTPGLELADAFGLLQSGMTLEAFLARKARSQKKQEVKAARSAVPPDAVDGFLTKLAADKTELAVVLLDRTLLDVLIQIRPVAFLLEKGGRIEKLQVVLVTSRSDWEQLSTGFTRDARLAQKPVPAPREPERRPYSDPRAFLPALGKPVHLLLRNGISLQGQLSSIGPFDLLVTVEGKGLFIPIHAVFRWENP